MVDKPKWELDADGRPILAAYLSAQFAGVTPNDVALRLEYVYLDQGQGKASALQLRMSPGAARQIAAALQQIAETAEAMPPIQKH